MRHKIIILLMLIFTAINVEANQRVRQVQVQRDQIVAVKTSLGIATIIQVPDRPNSVVVGDQEAFRVEYLEQAITIKPLSAGAKSNLYIYTDWRRYNVELISGPEAAADYVVYLETPKERHTSPAGSNSNIEWTVYKNQLRNGNLSLKVLRVGKTKNGLILVEFTISSKAKELFKPEWLWLTQEGMVTPIHNLFLSSLDVSTQKGLSGVLQIRKSDIDPNLPMRLELRKSRISYLTISKASSWRP